MLLKSRKAFLKNHPQVLAYIGDTPLFSCSHFNQNPRIELLIKSEFSNPSLSIKDRIVLHMIQDYETQGLLNKKQTIYEASSGNTGIALAMIGGLLGYHVVITTPEKTSKEKIKTMQVYGAKVIVCPSITDTTSPEHYTNQAQILAQQDPKGMYFNQYGSKENAEAHYLTTAKEIFEQTYGKLDYIVLGASSGGTVTGVGRFFKKYSPKTKIILADPIGSILYSHFYQLPEIAQEYELEGVGKDKSYDTLDYSVIDQIIQFSDEDAFQTVKDFAKTEGFLLGGSSGGALTVARKLINSLEHHQKAKIVVIAPDSGFKYLSKY
jgi:cysteine synthase